jgi:CheY-like chemotaxis protein
VLDVVICDDSTEIRKGIINILNTLSKDKFKLNSIEAANGYDCLAQIYQCEERKIKVDLLLIDEEMPYLKGSEVARMLKNFMNQFSFQRSMKIISISGGNDQDTIMNLRASGCDDVLSKAITKKDLETVVNSVLTK